jgi:threonine/homoserine/homoserine lactone efflux protein
MLALVATILPFAVSTSLTPGPNNLLVTASAANFGFARTMPHMLGVTIGFPVMFVAVGWGLGQVFESNPLIHHVLKYVGAAYLLYLAYRIAIADPSEPGTPAAKPFTFLQAAAFQWVNPKAWIIAIGAVTTYTTVGGELLLETLVMSGVFVPACFGSLVIWALFGLAIGRILKSGRALRAFNITMALLLAASLAPLVR